MDKLNTNDLEQVSGGRFSNAIYNDNMRSQLDLNLGNAEMNMDKSRFFMKLDESEKVTVNTVRRGSNSMSC